ncbi:VPLPA-CTERM sorting domain-containing protein [Halieaceae bacterium IMCC14734]|uniref:VPLPA-CTERM sorting domain-containing protein n=2 Tax=Candidatus Litorirhabdus singularis TaxID=2518993 RepID=A0ABT3TKT7_9GAMM|nr:VPLPA-CTERM sorting domain-containing protein [Candidatus Litorirhabdus singularis]
MTAGMSFSALSSAALQNGGFEDGDASNGDLGGASGWTSFETVFTNATDGPNFGPVSHDVGGTQSLKMYGPFSPGAAAGAFQSMAADAGQAYALEAWVMNWVGDSFKNLGILQLNFLDAGNNNIGGSQVTVDPFGTADVDLSIVQDGADVSDWTQLLVQGTAPVGTTQLEVFLLHIQTGEPCCAGGSLFWDDVSVSEVPLPAAAWLFGSALMGLVGMSRRRKS